MLERVGLPEYKTNEILLQLTVILCMYECIHMCVCVFICKSTKCMCVHMPVEARPWSQELFFRQCPPCFLRRSLSLGPGTNQLGKTGRTENLRDPLVSVSMVLRSEACSSCSVFCMDACMISTILYPSLQKYEQKLGVRMFLNAF